MKRENNQFKITKDTIRGQILKKTKIFDEIIVTTDSSKIQNISKKAGAKIYFTRPKNLSNDHVGTFEVLNHTINFLKKNMINIQNMFVGFILHQYY